MDKVAGNQHLQLTAKIWTNDTSLTLPTKEEKFQIVTNNKFPFLDTKMSWYLEGELEFRVFREKGHQLKYSGTGSTHTPGTLCAIPSGVLNRLSKLTFKKTFFSF